MSPESRNTRRDIKMHQNMNPVFPFLAKFQNWFKKKQYQYRGNILWGLRDWNQKDTVMQKVMKRIWARPWWCSGKKVMDNIANSGAEHNRPWQLLGLWGYGSFKSFLEAMAIPFTGTTHWARTQLFGSQLSGQKSKKGLWTTVIDARYKKSTKSARSTDTILKEEKNQVKGLTLLDLRLAISYSNQDSVLMREKMNRPIAQNGEPRNIPTSIQSINLWQRS